MYIILLQELKIELSLYCDLRSLNERLQIMSIFKNAQSLEWKENAEQRREWEVEIIDKSSIHAHITIVV